MISLGQHHYWKTTNALMVTPFRGLTLQVYLIDLLAVHYMLLEFFRTNSFPSSFSLEA
jgi:hypothetical protein